MVILISISRRQKLNILHNRKGYIMDEKDIITELNEYLKGEYMGIHA